MTALETVALVAALLAALAVGLFTVSLRADVVTGPPWAAWLVVAGFFGGWALAWFIAQATPAGSGWLPTAATAALAVLAAFGGGPVATSALRLTDPRVEIDDSVTPGPATPDLLRGGAVVGLLERVAVVTLLLIEYPEGIAVLLAIKGLGRFGELKIPAAPERFIVGTLASLLWALLGYAAIRAVLT
ncbi:MAG: hypothetical protein ACFCVG_03800 [Kineosporiaceae bacterium]